jgi:hypothetical protein
VDPDLDEVGIIEISEEIQDRFEPVVNNNLAEDLQLYTNDEFGIQFKYPQNWFIREEITKNNNRIYIENGENKNFKIGEFPDDFAMLWLDYNKPSPDHMSYDELLIMMANLPCNKKSIKRDSTSIYLCEFSFDPESEGHSGPRLEALWKYNGIRYSADTEDMVHGTGNMDIGIRQNELEVEVLEAILSTLIFNK